MDKETILDYVTKTPENTNRNVLGSMLNQFSKSSGGGLPEVTDADDGKILTVDGGEWTAVMPDKIILEGEIGENERVVLPMTYNEILSAINQKKQVIILIPPIDDGMSWSIMYALFAFADSGLYVIALGTSSINTLDPDSNIFAIG